MKKIFLSIILFCSLSIIFIPVLASAGLVTCNGPDCTIQNFFQMLVNIYNFIVLMIATPLAIIAVTVGGIFMMLGAGSPNMMASGKKIFWAAIIGLALVFCSYLIISTILGWLGFNISWQSPF